MSLRDQTTVASLVRPRLLVVDDLEDNRIIMTRRFQRRGFDVMEAQRGKEALELIGRERFDVVLLDIVMPDMDGFEVLARIREAHGSAELPVIMVTAKDGRLDIIQALKLGANDYLIKPVDFDVAHARVEANVARKHTADRAGVGQPETEALVVALRQAVQQAEAAARAKSEFLANISHEIRTPLNGILGLASALAEVINDDEHRAMVSTIIDSAVTLERLLSEALELSRVEAEKVEIHSRPSPPAASRVVVPGPAGAD